MKITFKDNSLFIYNEFIPFMIYECKLEGLVELGLRLFKGWDTYLLRPGTNLKLSTKRVIMNP